jgi:hypothetical protein
VIEDASTGKQNYKLQGNERTSVLFLFWCILVHICVTSPGHREALLEP